MYSSRVYRRRKRQTLARWLWCLTAVLTLRLAPARAEETPIAAAREAFMRGAALFEDEQYADAYAAFKASYESYPVATALYNLAMCEMILGSYVEAIASFERLLRENKDVLQQDMLLKAKASIKKLTAMVGTVTLVDPTPEAVVQIDGTAFTNGPVNEPMMLNPGQHTVSITRDGYNPLNTVVTIAAGSTVIIQAALAKTVETKPPAPTPAILPPVELSPTVTIHTDTGLIETAPRLPISPLFVSGCTTAFLGLVGLGTGGFFTYKQAQNIDAVQAAEQRLKTNHDKAQYRATYTDINNNHFPKANVGIKVGYISGGILLATGVALMTAFQIRHRDDGRFGIRPTLQGLAVAF